MNALLHLTRDHRTDRAGVFDKAIEMIKKGKRQGYFVCTNTMVYRETSLEEIEEMCAFLDGMLLSPGYHYAKLDDEHSCSRRRTASSSASSSSRRRTGSSRKDPRCRDCAMHSGFEPSVVRKMGGNLRDVLTMRRWQFTA